MSTADPTPHSLRTHARVAGLLYLVIIVCAGFAEGFVRSGMLVPGDAAATAANITAAPGLFRLGLAADLVAFLGDAGVAVLLYVVLRPVNRTLSLAAAAFRLVAHPAIGGINLLNHYAALLVLDGGPAGALAGFTAAQRDGLALLALEAHGAGYLIAGAFFAVSLFLLGHLVHRSGYMPAVLGVLLAVAGAGYAVETFGSFLLPRYDAIYVWVVAIPAVIGEVTFAVWLVAKGVRMDAVPPAAVPSTNAPDGAAKGVTR